MHTVLMRERAACLVSLFGFAILCASLASGLVAAPSKASARNASLDSVTSRLDAAAVARRDPHRADQFDALIGSLIAGLGVDIPEELGPPLRAIVIARSRESATQSAGARTLQAAADPEVDRLLAAVERDVGRLDAPHDQSGFLAEQLLLVSIAAGTVLMGAGLAFTNGALRVRRDERRAVGALCRCSPGTVHRGGLVAAVERRLADSARRDSAVRPTNASERANTTIEFDESDYGRILEIVAIDE
jgi:hypothetical protein